MSCELPRDSLPRNTLSCHPRQGSRGEGGVGECWNSRLTPGHHKHPLRRWFSPAVSDDSTAVMQNPQSQLPGRQLFAGAHTLRAAGEEGSSELLRELCRAKHLACPSCAPGQLPSPWAHRKCIQRKKRLCWNTPPPFCQAERQEGPAQPFHICYSPRSKTLIIEANCKTNGLLRPSSLFVALHYNDYRLTSMNCTSS